MHDGLCVCGVVQALSMYAVHALCVCVVHVFFVHAQCTCFVCMRLRR